MDGQGYGSFAPGLGQVMFEEASYTPDGLPGRAAAGVPLPTAADMPPVELLETETPNPNVPFGSKGAGEARLHRGPSGGRECGLRRPRH